MDPEILDKLNSYCSGLIGEKPTKSKKSEKKKSKKRKLDLNSSETFHIDKENDVKEVSTDKANNIEEVQTKVTDDGFKVVNEIPEDDSDISDAFSDLEDETLPSNIKNLERNSKTNKTEDGFKIVSSILSDDSDISDAFESDLDESEWLDEANHRLDTKSHKKDKSVDQNKNVEEEIKNDAKFKNIKKPLLHLIHDFGMQDKVYINKRSKPCFLRKETDQKPVMKSLSNEDIEVIDYSIKRGGTTKKVEVKETKKDKNKNESNKEELESSFKKARYEVFKFGLSAFDKEEKKQAKIELAVKLGAKPPKNSSTNYKKLIAERKLKKKTEINKREEDREMGIQTKKPVEVKQKKRGEGSLSLPIGKFRNGVLNLSKKDIANINSKR